MMNTKKDVFLFKIVLFLVDFHKCYFVFIEFEYYMKLFDWVMKTSLGYVFVMSLISWYFQYALE